MLIRIKNGYMSKKVGIIVKNSTFCVKVLELLYLNGFINGFNVIGNNIFVKLKYYQNNHIFKNLTIISKPGIRKYHTVKDLKRKYYYTNFVLVSTNLGLMVHKESISKNIGGEVLFSLSYS